MRPHREVKVQKVFWVNFYQLLKMHMLVEKGKFQELNSFVNNLCIIVQVVEHVV